MANIAGGGLDTTPVTPTQQQAVSTVSQTINYLHPVLQKFLASIPATVVTSHPAFPILVSSHPTIGSTVAAQGSSAPGFGNPTQPANLLTPPIGANGGLVPGGSSIGVQGSVPQGGGPNTGLTQGAGSGATTPPPIGTPTTTPTTQPTTKVGQPNPTIAQSPNQPLPVSGGPNAAAPIGNAASGAAAPGAAGSQPAPPINWGSLIGNTYSPGSGVMPGPAAMNHVPYGPELTGLSGYGGLITPNGTPVPMSAWQQANLDPTSIARYNSYVSDIAGMNPADLKQIGTTTTATQMPSLTPPTKFAPINPTPAPSGG